MSVQKTVIRNVNFDTPDNTVSIDPVLTVTPGTVSSRSSGGTSHILAALREKASFDKDEMMLFLDGGKKKQMKRKWIVSASEKMNALVRFYGSRSEIMRHHIQHFFAVHKDYLLNYLPTREEIGYMQEFSMASGSLMNHFGLFVPTLQMSCDDDQKNEYLPLAMTCQIIGAYAQTELGHGSNIRGLETVAVFDEGRKGFILDCPTLKSCKFWPGTLGKLATHAVVYAQLLIHGVEYGIHPFMVQVRDENHRPMKGMEIGDVGTCIGNAGTDCGFLRLTKIFVPLKGMLMGNAKVDEQGVYMKQKDSKANLNYTTMLVARASMIKASGAVLARGVTIGIRYAFLRHQGFMSHADRESLLQSIQSQQDDGRYTGGKKQSSTATWDDIIEAREDTVIGATKRMDTMECYRSPENPVAHYQPQRTRQLVQLGMAYGLKFIAQWIMGLISGLENNDIINGIVVTDSLLPIAHAASALKSYTCTSASEGLDVCRKTCGGVGYLLSSGVAALYADYLWQPCAEGEATVLLLSSGNALLQHMVKYSNNHISTSNSVSNNMSKEILTGPALYLRAAMSDTPLTLVKVDNLQYIATPVINMYTQAKPILPSLTGVIPSVKDLVTLVQNITVNHWKCLVASVEEEMKYHDYIEAAKSSSLLSTQCMEQHCFTILCTSYENAISKAPAQLQTMLHKLLGVLVFHKQHEKSIDLRDYIHGFTTHLQSMMYIRSRQAFQTAILEPDMIGLVDAFDMPDRVLNSMIGGSEGNCYEDQWNAALRSPMNTSDPYDGYYETQEPMESKDVLREGKITQGVELGKQ